MAETGTTFGLRSPMTGNRHQVFDFQEAPDIVLPADLRADVDALEDWGQTVELRPRSLAAYDVLHASVEMDAEEESFRRGAEIPDGTLRNEVLEEKIVIEPPAETYPLTPEDLLRLDEAWKAIGFASEITKVRYQWLLALISPDSSIGPEEVAAESQGVPPAASAPEADPAAPDLSELSGLMPRQLYDLAHVLLHHEVISKELVRFGLSGITENSLEKLRMYKPQSRPAEPGATPEVSLAARARERVAALEVAVTLINNVDKLRQYVQTVETLPSLPEYELVVGFFGKFCSDETLPRQLLQRVPYFTQVKI